MASGTTPKYADGTDSGWHTFDKTDKTYDGTISYRKLGNVVYIKSDGQLKNITANFTVGSLPSGFKPDTEQWFPVYAGYNVYAPAAFLRIYTGGSVQFGLSPLYTTASNTQFYFSVSYSL